MKSPSEIMTCLERVELGWEQNAPGDELNEITLAEYKTQVARSRDVRRRLAQNELEHAALINERTDTDAESMEMHDFAVDGARLSRRHGRNSTLLESFGYKRQSEYDSGLTRKGRAGSEPPNNLNGEK